MNLSSLEGDGGFAMDSTLRTNGLSTTSPSTAKGVKLPAWKAKKLAEPLKELLNFEGGLSPAEVRELVQLINYFSRLPAPRKMRLGELEDEIRSPNLKALEKGLYLLSRRTRLISIRSAGSISRDTLSKSHWRGANEIIKPYNTSDSKTLGEVSLHILATTHDERKRSLRRRDLREQLIIVIDDEGLRKARDLWERLMQLVRSIKRES